MVIESGLLVGIGVIVIYLKAPLFLRRLIAMHPFASDIVVFILLYRIHADGVTGTLSAAIAAFAFGVFVAVYSIYKRWR